MATPMRGTESPRQYQNHNLDTGVDYSRDLSLHPSNQALLHERGNGTAAG